MMNNIIKSHQYFLYRFRPFIISMLLLGYAIFIMFFINGSFDNADNKLLYPLEFVLMSACFPIVIETNLYQSKVAMYSIMMYNPRDILLGKLVAYLTVIIPFGLLPMTVWNLIFLHSTEEILFLAEIWILCLRTIAVIVFLSPIFKRKIFIYLITGYLFLLIKIFPTLKRPLSAVSDMLMAESINLSNVKETFPVILISTVFIVGGCYMAGWTVLKKKRSLE